VLLALHAFAGERCRAPDPLAALDEDDAADGVTYQLVENDHVVCWLVVADLAPTRIVHRWSRKDRYPVRIEALPDGRAALVMNDLRLQVRNVDDERYRNLDLYAPAYPTHVVGHPTRDWLAVTTPAGPGTTRVSVLDLDRERVIAAVALPEHDLALSFLSGDDVLWLDGAHALELTETGLQLRGRSP
jgi:tricorn protease-like protein